MPSRRQEIPVDESWRMVEGEHDSFDTTILPSLSPPTSSSSGLPSQPFSQGNVSFGSQDSIGDFARHPDDDQVILREPFRPSMSSASREQRPLTPEMEFHMPRVDVHGSEAGSSERTIRANSMGLGVRMGDEYRSNVRRRWKKDYDRAPPGSRSYRRMRSNEMEPTMLQDGLVSAVPSAILNIIIYFVNLFTLAFSYAQRPLAIFLAIYLTLGSLIMIQNLLFHSLAVAISPVCRIPGATLLHLPFCPSPDAIVPNAPEPDPLEFDDLMKVQGQFEQVLEMSVEGVGLAWDMKRSETAVRDLRTLVKHSEIQARDELVLEFDGFVDVAGRVSKDLQRFLTRLGSAVDAVISINRWTSRFIDEMASKPDDEDKSLLAQGLAWLFHPFQATDAIFSERALYDQYMEHTGLVSERIASLIAEARAVLNLLTQAEDHLSVIHDITSRSTAAVSADRNDMLNTLWSLVGGNKARLHNLADRLALLKQVDAQRLSAVAQVTTLVVELESIQASLSELRDRVAAPELLPHAAVPVPLSVHVETINRGVERLAEARSRMSEAHDVQIKLALAKSGVPVDVDEERLIAGSKPKVKRVS